MTAAAMSALLLTVQKPEYLRIDRGLAFSTGARPATCAVRVGRRILISWQQLEVLLEGEAPQP